LTTFPGRKSWKPRAEPPPREAESRELKFERDDRIMPQRWRIFTILAPLLMVSLFFRISMAVSARDLSQEFGLTAAQLGVLSAIFFYVFAFAQLPLGPLLDRYGGRRTISLLGVITTLGAVTFALAPGYHVALLGRFLLGLGTAGVFMGSLKIFTNWFTMEEFPTVTGVMIAMGNLGNMLATAPLAHAITHFGWRNTFLAASLIQALLTLTVYTIVSDAPQDGKVMAHAAEGTAAKVDGAILEGWRIIFLHPTFWCTSLIAFFWYGNYMVLQSLWGGPYLMEAVGMSRGEAGNMLLLVSIGYILGSLLLGKTIDRFSGSLRKTIMTGQAILVLVMTMMLGPAESFSRLPLMASFFAIGLVSSTGVIIYPLARALVPHQFAASALTGVNFFLLLGAALVQHIMGIYIEAFPRGPAGYPAQAYHGAFLIPICGLIMAIVLFGLVGKRTPGS